ncbi:hypothetical protein [Pseudoalteromonas sp.]|uniref:hypothetical protein n=1 Tax=Pseudoalteromonas sp. TaxID=53249 RepID=UPI0026197A7D|nr:hypothetical protein [Pseudoalteromonas sp.]MCP4586910.1 hypothetical protein [Pseudoalteromonas sp.]
MADLITMNEREFATHRLVELMKPEVYLTIEEINCKGLLISTDQLEALLEPLRCLNGLVPEVTWHFDYLEDRKTEEEGLLSVVS